MSTFGTFVGGRADRRLRVATLAYVFGVVFITSSSLPGPLALGIGRGTS